MVDEPLSAHLHAVHSGDPEQVRTAPAEDAMVDSPIIEGLGR